MPSSILRATTGDSHPSYPGNDRIVTLPTSCTGASESSPTPTTSMDLVVLDGQSRFMPRPTPPSSAAAASPTGLSAKIARRAWPRGTPASEQPIYQSYLPTAPQSARAQPLSPGSHRQVVSAHQGSMSARQPQYDGHGHRIGGRPGSAPGKARVGSPLATKDSAKQLQFELAMTGQVFKCAQNELELERRRTRDARAREERSRIAVEVARVEVEAKLAASEDARAHSERQLAQLLAEQRAALERELVDSEKVAQERLAQERAEREALARQRDEIEEQLGEIDALKVERDEARREAEQLLVAERDRHARALERLRVELSGGAEEVQAARAAQARRERLEAMQSKAAARIKNQGLLRGWGVWAQQWASGAKQRRQLAAAGARLMRPALIAKFGHWRADWAAAAGEEAAQRAKGSAQLLEEAERKAAALQQRLAQLQEQHADALAVAQRDKQAALARQRGDLLGSAEAQQAAKEEAARDARIEQMKAKAMGRIKNQGIMAGWARWHEEWAELSKQRRQLAAAGARLTRPALVKTFGLWKADWQGEAALSLEQQIEKRDGAIEALETALLAEKAAAAALLEAAEAKARELEGKVTALLAGQMDAEAQAALKEEQAKERRVEELKTKAMRRIANQGLMKGWAVWHEVWEAKAKKRRMLAAAGAKLTRPQLVASLERWKVGWAAEMAAQKGATFEQRLKQSEVRREEAEGELAAQRSKAARLAEEVDELRAAAEHERRAAEAKHAAAIERLKTELVGSAEEQAAAREEAAREARVEQMKAKAMGRIKNQGIMAGWSQWHEVWAEAAKQRRQLAAVGAKLTRPGLVAALAHWKADWQGEAAASTVAGQKALLESTQAALQKLEVELASERADSQAQLGAMRDTHAHALERLKQELTGDGEAARAAREEREREARVEQMKAKAMGRIKNQGIMAGWSQWHEVWAEAAKQRRQLAAAGARLTRPLLVKTFSEWKTDWSAAAAEAAAEAAKGHKQQLREAKTRARELEKELHEARAAHRAEAAAAERRRRELEAQLSSAPSADKLAEELRRKEEAAKETRVDEMKAKATRRLKNQGILTGWGRWHEQWAERARRHRLMQRAASKLVRPKLVQGLSRFRANRDAARASLDAAAGSSALDEQQRLNAELRAELERLREAATSGAAKVESELVARTRAEDRERRVGRAQSAAAKRLVHKDLARGWESWAAMARAHNRRELRLADAARRIHRPKLMAAWSFWTTEHQRMRRDAVMRQAERDAEAKLREMQRQAEAKLIAERKAATEARRELDAHVKELARQLEAYHISVAEAPPPDPVVIVLHDIAASGVPDADAAGGADPYARFSILLDSQTPKKEMAYTTYKVSDVNPVWDDERLQLKIAPEDPRPLTLRVEMWDKDMNSPDDIMAAADVQLDPATMVVGGTATHTLRLKGVDDSDDVEEFTFAYTLLAEEEEAAVVDKAKMRAAKEALAKKAGFKGTSDGPSTTRAAANPAPGGRKR